MNEKLADVLGAVRDLLTQARFTPRIHSSPLDEQIADLSRAYEGYVDECLALDPLDARFDQCEHRGPVRKGFRDRCVLEVGHGGDHQNFSGGTLLVDPSNTVSSPWHGAR